VIHNGKVGGIVSDRDLHRVIAREWIEQERGTWDVDEQDDTEQHRSCIRDIMTRHVETIGPHATLSAAADRMIQRKIGSLPVVDHGELVGVLTETDLLRALEAACSASAE